MELAYLKVPTFPDRVRTMGLRSGLAATSASCDVLFISSVYVDISHCKPPAAAKKQSRGGGGGTDVDHPSHETEVYRSFRGRSHVVRHIVLGDIGVIVEEVLVVVTVSILASTIPSAMPPPIAEK